jgi:hypothetical protein
LKQSIFLRAGGKWKEMELQGTVMWKGKVRRLGQHSEWNAKCGGLGEERKWNGRVHNSVERNGLKVLGRKRNGMAVYSGKEWSGGLGEERK